LFVSDIETPRHGDRVNCSAYVTLCSHKRKPAANMGIRNDLPLPLVLN